MDARARASAHDLAIVVVSWNVRALLERCLESVFAELARLPGWPAVVWVVDNASGDGSADMVYQRFPQVRLIANPDNRGFAAANNQALRALGFASDRSSDGLPRYAAFLNPDTTLEQGALGAWLEAAESHPAAGIVGAALRYPDGRFQHSAFSFPSLAQILLDFYPLHYRLIDSRLNGRYPRQFYERGEPFPIDHPLGAAMLARREAIEATGLLDEGFFIYAEEVDWCMRMRAAGWPALCAPAVHIVHHEAQSTHQFRERMFVALWKSRLRLFAKGYSPAFNWMARRLIRLGVGKLRREATRMYREGAIARDAWERRLAAFDEVIQLTRMGVLHEHTSPQRGDSGA
jgi:N-acetylglucosaminyl-diphospho-decaprenol L-rhamnosyltransferase